MDRIGKVARRPAIGGKPAKPGMHLDAVRSGQGAHRPRSPAQPCDLYGIKRHTPPLPKSCSPQTGTFANSAQVYTEPRKDVVYSVFT
jgi:hypothetical protein